MALAPGAWVNLLSGALMAALGVLLLVANPRKDWNRVFALFAVFWGAQIAAANAVRVVETEQAARLAGELALAFLVPLAFFLVMFASIFPRPAAPFGTSPLAVAALLAPAALALVLLFLDPALLLRGVRPAEAGGFTLVWGPAFPPLLVAPLYGAFFYATFLMMRRLEEADSPVERRQVGIVLASLALFVAYNVPVQLWLFARGAAETAQPAESLFIAAVMLVGFALLLLLGARLARRARRAPDPAARKEARALVAAVGASGALGLAVVGVLAAGGPRVDALGLVRIASIALMGYGVARWQLFDIDLRVKSAAAVGAALVAAGALAAALWAGARDAGLAAPTRSLVVAAAGLAALLPALRLTTRLADRVAPRVSRDGDHLYLRRLDVYRAGVETLLREGREGRADEPLLVELRQKLGLAERDHDVVLHLALARADAAPPAPDLRPGGVAFGKYLVEGTLAQGGYGRVFLARDRILDRPVVIKELLARWRGDPRVARTFLREAQIAGRLHHPNIVTVYEVERHGEDHYIVMEHVKGGTLAERMGDGTLGVDEALRVARAVLDALAAAHAQGVVHRDVKPANVLLDERGVAKLADFGVAQLAAEAPDRTVSGLTTQGPQPGTLQYMSPEQARGEPVDARSDLYAVGALLHRMLTGRPHLDLAGLDEWTARARVAAAPPPAPLPGVPAWLGAAVAKALAPDPAGRFRTAAEFQRALLPSTARLSQA